MTTVITAIRPATAGSVAELVRASSPESLRRRFTLGRAFEPDEILARYGRFLLAGTSLVAEASGVPAGLLNAVPDDERRVELGLLVADGWQRRGIARGLVGLVTGGERWLGWTLHATVQEGNVAAEGLLRACGFRFAPGYGGENEFELTVTKEALDGGTAGARPDGHQRCAAAAYARSERHRYARSGGTCRSAAGVAAALLPGR
ncbi:GNAT family N-acetyltransferase [Amycolatopsis benzoatilytica]|uniref:GNAT family N-acetyltransferase n=1 Tax=Amycolatopsis benzoatilytica TaxID=346045 RepID=UPI000555221B|nr:GNAT family N-acetyltransferase [Amycolatopsis benzoatilytica]